MSEPLFLQSVMQEKNLGVEPSYVMSLVMTSQVKNRGILGHLSSSKWSFKGVKWSLRGNRPSNFVCRTP